MYTTKVGHQALNQLTITVMAMSIKRITLMDKGLGQCQDPFQDQSPNHLPDQDPLPLQCQETARPIQVRSYQNRSIEYSVSIN